MEENLIRDLQLLSLTEMTAKEKLTYLKGVYADYTDSQLQKFIKTRFSAGMIIDSLKQPWRKFQGKRFEGFIVRKLKSTCKLSHWSNDKHTQEVFDPEAQNPDLVFSSKADAKKVFAVECKWHEQKRDKVIIAKSLDKLNQYAAFGERNNIPVFIAVGVGNNGDAPEEVYIVPLERLNRNRITYPADFLSTYRAVNISHVFMSLLDSAEVLTATTDACACS